MVRVTGRAWYGVAAQAMVLALLPALAMAQGAGGTVRGRVLDQAGGPLAGVRVVARAPSLTLHRETRTNADGRYVLPGLPPGDYVVSFEHPAYVTVRHTTDLAARQTVRADAALAATARSDEFITVSIDDEALLRASAADAVRHDELDRLPLAGGLQSVRVVARGPLDTRSSGVRVSIDGTPLRLDPVGAGPALVDPGAEAFENATLLPAAAPAEVGPLGLGAVSVSTRPGGDRLTGEVRGVAATADRFADDVERAGPTRSPAGGVGFHAGLPLQARRTWLFLAGRRGAEPTTAHARLADAAFPGAAIDRFVEVKATHALRPDHRLQILALDGRRELRDAPPAGARWAETASALGSRRLTHRLLSASYAGTAGRGWQLSMQVAREQSRRHLLGGAAAGPLVRDRATGAAAGWAGGCGGCVETALDVTSWGATAHRLMSWPGGGHLLTAGIDGSRGHLDPQVDAGAGGLELLPTRLVHDAGGVRPVLAGDGSAWLVRRTAGGRFTHAATGVFVADEWQGAEAVTVRGGLRWDRQTLAVDGAAAPFVEQQGFSPRLHLAWHPFGPDGWRVLAGAARYEADVLDLADEPLVPSGDWIRYDGPPVDSGGEADAWAREGGTARFEGLDAPRAALATRAPGVLAPTVEWTAGAGRRYGDLLRVRADVIWRRSEPAAPTAAPDATAQSAGRADSVELGLLTRRYTALAVQAEYVVGLRAALTAQYTLSCLRGVPAATGDALAVSRWAAPGGDLTGDRRHRLRLWGHVILFEDDDTGVADLAVLQTYASEQPYGAVGWIDASPWVQVDGAGPRLLPYYFTTRDALRTKAALRTDLSFRYARLVPGTLRSEVFVQVEVLNLFDKERVADAQGYAAVRTALTDPGRLAPFNPLTTAPELGVHWEVDPRLSEAFASAPETMPREYRVSVGVRF